MLSWPALRSKPLPRTCRAWLHALPHALLKYAATQDRLQDDVEAATPKTSNCGLFTSTCRPLLNLECRSYLFDAPESPPAVPAPRSSAVAMIKQEIAPIHLPLAFQRLVVQYRYYGLQLYDVSTGTSRRLLNRQSSSLELDIVLQLPLPPPPTCRKHEAPRREVEVPGSVHLPHAVHVS